MARIKPGVAAALTSLAFAGIASADPFDVSTQRCEEITTLHCFEIPVGQIRSFTLAEAVDHWRPQLTLERLRYLNGWDETVDWNTPVREGSSVAFAGEVSSN